jgi:hypothetical protein
LEPPIVDSVHGAIGLKTFRARVIGGIDSAIHGGGENPLDASLRGKYLVEDVSFGLG